MKKEYEVKNITKYKKQFIDRHSGKVIILNSGEVAITTCPPKNLNVFSVKEFELTEKKIKKKKTMEE